MWQGAPAPPWAPSRSSSETHARRLSTMSGATSNLPTLDGVDSASENATAGLSGFLSLTGSLGTGASSPLQSVLSAMSGLEGHLNIDLSGLSERLPQALTTIQNA